MHLELKVKKIQRKVLDTEEADDVENYTMALASPTGAIKVTVSQDSPFVGFRPKQDVVVELKNPQKTIAESVGDDGPLSHKEESKNMTADLSGDHKHRYNGKNPHCVICSEKKGRKAIKVLRKRK